VAASSVVMTMGTARVAFGVCLTCCWWCDCRWSLWA